MSRSFKKWMLLFVVLGCASWMIYKLCLYIHYRNHVSEVLTQFHTSLASDDYPRASILIKEEIEEAVSFQDFKDVEHPSVRKAFLAVQAIRSLKGCPEYSIADLFQAALFIERDLQCTENSFFPKSQTKLAFDLEYDACTGYRFIHFDGQCAAGKKKVVTKSILYDGEKSILVARGQQIMPMDQELKATMALKGAPGVYDVKAYTKRREGEEEITTLFSRFYLSGSLQQVLDNGEQFTLHEKMHIAKTLLQGLNEIHKRGFVHCDLGARNYFIDISEGDPGMRVIDVAVADLGRAAPIETIAGEKVQGNVTYTAPEGVFRSKMKGKDYLKSDIFALGCVLYRLFYERKHEWRSYKCIRGIAPENSRYKKLMQRIQKHTDGRRNILMHRKWRKEALYPQDQFEFLILKMVSPNPEERGTAEQLLQEMDRIIHS